MNRNIILKIYKCLFKALFLILIINNLQEKHFSIFVAGSESEMEHDDLVIGEIVSRQTVPPLGGSTKSGSFRDKKPNLTIKVVPT